MFKPRGRISSLSGFGSYVLLIKQQLCLVRGRENIEMECDQKSAFACSKSGTVEMKWNMNFFQVKNSFHPLVHTDIIYKEGT